METCIYLFTQTLTMLSWFSCFHWKKKSGRRVCLSIKGFQALSVTQASRAFLLLFFRNLNQIAVKNTAPSGLMARGGRQTIYVGIPAWFCGLGWVWICDSINESLDQSKLFCCTFSGWMLGASRIPSVPLLLTISPVVSTKIGLIWDRFLIWNYVDFC